MRKAIGYRVTLAAVVASLLAASADEAFARGGGRGGGGGGGMRAGGGMRSSGASSISRGGGGGGGGSRSFSRPSGGSYAGGGRATGGAGRSGGANRPSQLPSGGRGQTSIAQGGGRVQGGNRVQGGDRANIGSGNRGNRVNTGDVNFNRNTNVSGDFDGWGGWHDYPVGAGLAIGATAAFTAAAIGSSYYALPPGCPPYPYGGYTYYSCGGAYYEPRYEGDTVVYVTVPPPEGAPAG